MTDEESPRPRKGRAKKKRRRGPGRPKDRHDRLVRDVLAQPELIAGELRTVLSPELVAALDWSSVEREPGTFVDEEGESRTDLLFSIALRGGQGGSEGRRRLFVYVLFEHQSNPDRLMVLRFLGYLSRAWLEVGSQPRHADGLPPIVPVVLHHGEGGWTAPRRLSDLLALDEALASALGPYIPDFELLVDDLTKTPELSLAERRMHPAALLVLVALRVDRLGHDPALTSRWAEVLNDAAATADQRGAFGHILRYIFGSESGSEWFEALSAEALSAATKEGIVTLQQQWLQEGIEKGIEQGQAALLLEQLEERFGALGPEVVSRVRGADASALRRWGRAVLTAETPEDVFS